MAKEAFQATRDEDTRLTAELPKLEKTLADARQTLDKLAAQGREQAAAAKSIDEQSQILTTAVAKLNAAAAALASDQTLSEAVTKIAAQSNELNSLAAAAQKTAAEPVPADANAAQALATAETALETTKAKRPTPAKLRDLEQALLLAQHRYSDRLFTIAAYDNHIATAQSLLDYSTLVKSEPVKAAAAWTTIVEKWTIANQVAPLKSLTAEQMAASVMQATGMYARQIDAAQAAVDKTPPASLKNAAEAEKPRLRANLTELELISQIRGSSAEFVRQYGSLPGEEFQATVNQALFFGNGNSLDTWLKPSGQNLIAALDKLDARELIIDKLYWSILSRPPTSAEQRAARDYFQTTPSTARAELAWALLSSTEFRFNH